MDLEETIQNPFFWIITGVGYLAFVMMLMVLKGMGNQDIMPLWVKIVTLIFIPVAGYIFTKIYDT
jgi:uncharacterized membrane protein